MQYTEGQKLALAKAFGEKGPIPGMYILKNICYMDGAEMCQHFGMEPNVENMAKMATLLREAAADLCPDTKFKVAHLKDKSYE